MAVERIERRLRQVTRALDEQSILYAAVGGNAAAAWVACVDPAATRTTRNVDLLVRMRLASLRAIDRVQIADLLSAGLIDGHVRASLPADLHTRLAESERCREAEG